MKKPHTSRHSSLGFTLVELLVALAVGLLLLAALSMIFLNASEANREIQKTSQQIENGRYAMDVLSRELRHAGFYGHLHEIPVVAAFFDPCETSNAAVLKDALSVAIQGFAAPDLATAADVSATTCDDKGLLTAANLRPGSDVLVVRRADTQALPPASIAVLNEVYLQATGTQSEVQFGNGAPVGSNKASGGPSTLFLKNSVTPAPIRKLHVRVYFVAPCSVGTGAAGVCAPGDDTIPTLKRLELVASGGATTMQLTPLVEGIEYLRVEFGVDSQPAAVNPATGLTGDSTIDLHTATPADWSQVIGAKVYVLARNNEPTTHHSDSKSYTLGTTVVPATNDRYKRHVYAAAVRAMNPAGRREIP
jgi:type IV pilus assembly protein PilW